MSGKLKGRFFRLIIKSMLSTQLLFPEFRERIQAMNKEDWYDWDEYCLMARTIAESLDYAVIVGIGEKIVLHSQYIFEGQGFNSADSILKDYVQLFRQNVKDTPPTDPPRTIKYRPGFAIIEAGIVQPRALIEGYLRGIIKIYGATLLSFSAETIDDLHHFEIAWK